MKTIVVKLQKEGIHCFPRAGVDPNLKDVSYLQYPHRHVFHILAEIEVFDDDREIEFIKLKNELSEFLSDSNFGEKSCEMIAQDIVSFLDEKYGKDRYIFVEVLEDGENGARVYY